MESRQGPWFQSLVSASLDPKLCQQCPPLSMTRRFRSLQQQSLPLKSIYTDSTIPTLKFPPNSEAAALDKDMVNAHETALLLQAKVAVHDELRPESTSESGWTAYLDQSSDSRCPGTEDESLLDEDRREDPSMASDASSGPEQPEMNKRRCSRKPCNVVKESRKRSAQLHQEEDDLDDTCQSNLSCESVSNDPGPDRRQLKRRKVESHREDSEIGEGHSDENEVEIDAGESEICSHPSLNSIGNAVDTRLDVLQHLIPDSRVQLDEELGVAIDYVKSLEKKMKIFQAPDKTCLSRLAALQQNPSFKLSMVAT